MLDCYEESKIIIKCKINLYIQILIYLYDIISILSIVSYYLSSTGKYIYFYQLYKPQNILT